MFHRLREAANRKASLTRSAPWHQRRKGRRARSGAVHPFLQSRGGTDGLTTQSEARACRRVPKDQHPRIRFVAVRSASPRPQVRVSARHVWFPVEWLRLLRKERSTLAVAAAISSFVDRDGWAWPSRATIAKLAGVDTRTVTKAVARLRRLGLMTVEERSGKSSVYSMATEGNSDPGLPQPRTLGNSAPVTLVRGNPPERNSERYKKR
jgi:hypothetical protein